MSLNRTVPPSFQPSGDFLMTKAERHVLANGIQVFTVKAGNQPILNLQLLFNAGRWFEEKQLAAHFTAKMLLEGAGGLTSKQINESFENLGAFKEASAGSDVLELEVYCLSKHLGEVLDLVLPIVSDPVFPEHELENLKLVSSQHLKVNQENDSYVAGSVFKEHMFGPEHPYGYPFTEEKIDQITRDDLIGHHQASVAGHPFIIVLAGLVEERHINLLDKTLGGIRLDKHPKPGGTPLPFGFQPGRHVREREGALQVSLRMGCPMFGLGDPGYFAFEVFNELLGGYFGSRLMKNIREDKGYTYGIYSSASHFRHGHYFTIGTDVIKEKAHEVVDEVYREIDKLCQEPVGNVELSLVKNYMAGNYLKSISTPVAVAHYFKTLYFHGLPENYFDAYVTHLNAVTAADIQAIAQTCFSGKMLEVLAG